MNTQKWDGKSEFVVEREIQGCRFLLAICSDNKLYEMGLPYYSGPALVWGPKMPVMQLPHRFFHRHYTVEEMRVVYWHEVGHLLGDHLSYVMSWGNALWQEVEADMFSATKTSPKQVVDLLEKGNRVLGFSQATKDRIEILKEYYKLQ